MIQRISSIFILFVYYIVYNNYFIIINKYNLINRYCEARKYLSFFLHLPPEKLGYCRSYNKQFGSNLLYKKKIIGNGGFGTVSLADITLHNTFMKEVVIKQLLYLVQTKIPNADKNSTIIEKEINILHQLQESIIDESHVIQLINYDSSTIQFMKTNQMIIFKEMGYSLEKFIGKKKQNFRNTFANRVEKDIKMSLEFIKKKCICHTDIRPPNIMWFGKFDNTGKAKLIDFGLACKDGENLQCERSRQALWYSSKDILDQIATENKNENEIIYLNKYDEDSLKYIKYYIATNNVTATWLLQSNEINDDSITNREEAVTNYDYGIEFSW